MHFADTPIQRWLINCLYLSVKLILLDPGENLSCPRIDTTLALLILCQVENCSFGKAFLIVEMLSWNVFSYCGLIDGLKW